MAWDIIIGMDLVTEGGPKRHGRLIIGTFACVCGEILICILCMCVSTLGEVRIFRLIGLIKDGM